MRPTLSGRREGLFEVRAIVVAGDDTTPLRDHEAPPWLAPESDADA
jgi:hypothetical protein